MLSMIKAGIIASFCLMLMACANASYHIKHISTDKQSHLIEKVPFYPQQTFYCGPTTLAEVANFYGHELTPEQIAPQIFIPKREGSLQLEMVAATRQLGLVAYTDNGDLNQLIALVKQDVPVIVLQNNGLSWLPQWHYSVVIGFDLAQESIILHSGLDQNIKVNIGVFMNTWQRSNYWYLAPMPAEQKPTSLNAFRYVKALQDLFDTQQTNTAVQGLYSATTLWPDYWLSYFLLGNYFYQVDKQQALKHYQAGLKHAPAASNEADYLNNYAYVLAELGCQQQALEVINQASTLAPDDANIQQSAKELINYTSTATCSAGSL